MVSNRCKMAVKEELKKLGLHFMVVDLGEVEILEITEINKSHDNIDTRNVNRLLEKAKL